MFSFSSDEDKTKASTSNEGQVKSIQSNPDWGIQSFSAAKLTGTYSKLSLKPKHDQEISQSQIIPKSPAETQLQVHKKEKDMPSGVVNPPVKDTDINTKSTTPEKLLNGVQLLTVTRKLLFSIRLQQDKWRYEKVCRLILQNCNSDQSVKVQ